MVLPEKNRRQLSRKSDLTRIGTVGPRCRPPILLQLSTTFSSKGEFGFSQKKSAASKLGKLEKISRQLSRKSDLTRIGTVGPRCRPPILLQLSISHSYFSGRRFLPSRKTLTFRVADFPSSRKILHFRVADFTPSRASKSKEITSYEVLGG